MIETIKVAGTPYVIKYTPDIDKDGLLGLANFNTREIFINNLYPKEQQEETLLHEIIHVVNYAYNVGLDEDAVDKLARGMYATIRENPSYKIREN